MYTVASGLLKSRRCAVKYTQNPARLPLWALRGISTSVTRYETRTTKRAPSLSKSESINDLVSRTGTLLVGARIGLHVPGTCRYFSTHQSQVASERGGDGNGDGGGGGSAGGMEDEYGEMDDSGDTFVVNNFDLEGGARLADAQVRYNTFGELNSARDNVIVVCHALTGNARLDEWWGPMLGPGLPFDTNKYLVVCANVLGSCYGSSGPQSIRPDTKEAYGMGFPDVTIRDTVRLHMRMVKEGIGARGVRCVVGGSMGGMQALEWAIQGQDYVKGCVVIGCGSEHTAWQIAISEVQRQALYADPNWKAGYFDPKCPPDKGLALARQIAMVSYRTAQGYSNKFGRERDEKSDQFQVRRYLEYQGTKFLDRFDAVTYVKLTEQMDTHDVGRGRGGAEAALASISAQTLVMGMDSDILYPLADQKALHDRIHNADFQTIVTAEGHDGFLLEYDQVGSAVGAHLEALEK